MAVLYRALWTDSDSNPDDYIANARVLFSAWATGDEAGQTDPLQDGETIVEGGKHSGGAVTVRSVGASESSAEEQGNLGVECVLREVDAAGATWTTMLRALATSAGVSIWVENRVETDDIARRFSVGRPRLVDDLIAASTKPRLGGSAVSTQAEAIPAPLIQGLVDYLTSEQRSLPVIVVSEPRIPTERSVARAGRIATRVAGVATVITLDADAVTAFRQRVGDLAIWGGGVRIYIPGFAVESSDGWRHRYYLGDLIDQRESQTIDRIVYSVTQMSARRPVPDEFLDFTSGASSPDTLTEYDVQHEREFLELALSGQMDQANETARELAVATGHLNRIKAALGAANLHHIYYGSQHEESGGTPDEVQDTSEAVLAAQTYLSDWIEVPEKAIRDLEGIDTSSSAYAWGNTAWRGLQALAAFAEARSGDYQGSFWDWCKTGAPLCWPATQKKLSMRESETVQNSKKMSAARLLPVSLEVDSSGSVTMWSHLKIAEGGGDLAPRIYFFDDTAGDSGKVHVGFVGPHYLMRNTRS